MDIQRELAVLALELERLDQRLQSARNTYESEVCDIADALMIAHDKRAVLLAASHGVEVGTELVIMTPHVWNGKLFSGLHIRVERISSGGEDAVYYDASVKTKSGWSKRWTFTRASNCTIANTVANTDAE